MKRLVNGRRNMQREHKIWITIRMDKTITVLTWFAMATLALGIARQLSEQKQLAFIIPRYAPAL